MRTSLSVMKTRKLLTGLLYLAGFVLLIGCGGRKIKYIDGLSFATPSNLDYAVIVGSDPSFETFVIPEKYEDKWVREISDAFSEGALTHITIPNWIQILSRGAFTDCHNLKEVLIEGTPKYYDGSFLRCDALESVTFEKGIDNINMGIFEDCPALKEIHVPVGCNTITGTVAKGVTLFLRTEDQVKLALENGWDFRMENGTAIVTTDLKDAVGSGMIEVSIDDSSVLKIDFYNAGDDMLIIENTREFEFTQDGKTYYLTGSNLNGYFVIKPHGRQERFADYFTEYGPEQTTVQVAAESEYMTVQLYAGKHELQDEFLVAPYERRTLTLPFGRYSMSILQGDTEEEVRPGNAEDAQWRDITTWDFEADKFYEVSPGLGGGFGVYELEEYGPGTSSLYLAARDDFSCYRLVRVGGEVELEVFLEPHIKKTVSFPSGVYRLRIAYGENWISDEEAFGEEGEYSAIDYFHYKDGETYEITTTTGTGNVHGDTSGGFGH